jgi:hypothetical protein
MFKWLNKQTNNKNVVVLLGIKQQLQELTALIPDQLKTPRFWILNENAGIEDDADSKKGKWLSLKKRIFLHSLDDVLNCNGDCVPDV